MNLMKTRCPALPTTTYCYGFAVELPRSCKRLPMRPAYLWLCEVA